MLPWLTDRGDLAETLYLSPEASAAEVEAEAAALRLAAPAAVLVLYTCSMLAASLPVSDEWPGTGWAVHTLFRFTGFWWDDLFARPAGAAPFRAYFWGTSAVFWCSVAWQFWWTGRRPGFAARAHFGRGCAEVLLGVALVLALHALVIPRAYGREWTKALADVAR